MSNTADMTVIYAKHLDYNLQKQTENALISVYTTQQIYWESY